MSTIGVSDKLSERILDFQVALHATAHVYSDVLLILFLNLSLTNRLYLHKHKMNYICMYIYIYIYIYIYNWHTALVSINNDAANDANVS